MTDWGSHGAGTESETLTPFVAWGSGIKKSQNVENCDEFESFRRNDKFKTISQIDIASTISALLSIPTPSNSLGTLPNNLINSDDQNLRNMIHGKD
jgi:phosphatidylinositol glycan class N